MNIRWETILAWIPALLGITSCSKIGGGMVCMYGMPTADYDVNLIVTDEDGNPVTGIEATPLYGYDSLKSYTDKNGKVELILEGHSTPEVRLTDIDGEENGGEFETYPVKRDELKIEQIKKGDNAWYQGAFKASGSVKLTRKKSDK